MAVFTEVTAEAAQTLLSELNLGQLRELRGIQGGIENTNYFATTSEGEYVLTLFERLTFEQLPFYLHLMKHLALRGIPVPDPQANASGDILHTVCGKPAAVVNRLRGRSDALRLPCFWLRPGCTVLPAFGDFTGGAPVVAERHDVLVLTDGTRLYRLPAGGRVDSTAA